MGGASSVMMAGLFMTTNFTDEGTEVRELFRALLFKGKRDVHNSSPFQGQARCT